MPSRFLMIVVMTAGLLVTAQTDGANLYRSDASPDMGTSSPGPTDPNGPPSA